MRASLSCRKLCVLVVDGRTAVVIVAKKISKDEPESRQEIEEVSLKPASVHYA